MNVISIFDLLSQFIRIGAFGIYINFNDSQQFAFFIKQCLFHAGELSDQIVKAITNRISLNLDNIQTIGKLAMSLMNVHSYTHALLLSL
jgi:hypothetical protein